ncbi:MAG TPA: DUF4105 domain-containing protein [Longimicrobiales bacterium]|nr:DUF4105 domain-containing protein [Longimicrobiales bacterium]
MKKLLLILLLGFATAARAQTEGENLHVYLLTFGPGKEVWERFGHDALVVEDRASNYSVAWNWGMFDFGQPHFLRNFVKGRMNYWMSGSYMPGLIQFYADSLKRSVWIQELNLTPQQKIALKGFTEWNSLDENKFYQYDYYRDNCTTRIRDALNTVLNGEVSRQLKAIPTASTYRSQTKALTLNDPLLYEGLMLAMGQNIDQPLTAWEESFLPMELQSWVRSVKVRNTAGKMQSLVLSERTYFQGPAVPIADETPSRVIPFTIAGILIAGLIVLLGRLSQEKRAATVALAVVVTIWCLVSGILGTIIELLWAGTSHMVTYRNENVLQANSIVLMLAIFAGPAIVGKIWARRWSVWLALFVAGLSVLGFMLQIFPVLDQNNGEVIGLFMPVHGAVAWVLWHRWRVRQLAT